MDTEALGGAVLPQRHPAQEGALSCTFLVTGQIWCYAPPHPQLGGSLAFLGTDVGWDLALPGSNRLEREASLPSPWVDDGEERLPKHCPDWDTCPPLIPRSWSFPTRAEQAPGTEATAPRTNPSPRSVSMDFAIRVTGDPGCKAYGGAGNFLLKTKFKKENLKKINVRISPKCY